MIKITQLKRPQVRRPRFPTFAAEGEKLSSALKCAAGAQWCEEERNENKSD